MNAEPASAMNPSSGRPRSGRQISRWMLLALLLIQIFGIPASAGAAIIYSGVQNIAIDNTFDGTYLNVDTSTHSSSVITGWDVNFFFGGYGIANSTAFQAVRASTDNMAPVLNLAAGTLIDGSSIYSYGEAGSDSHMGTGALQFAPGTDGLIGFRLTTDGGAGPYYGWMRVDLTYNTSGAVIKDWAYDDSGSAVSAGSLLSTPEPGRTLHLLLGGICLMMCRRRKSGSGWLI